MLGACDGDSGMVSSMSLKAAILPVEFLLLAMKGRGIQSGAERVLFFAPRVFFFSVFLFCVFSVSSIKPL